MSEPESKQAETGNGCCSGCRCSVKCFIMVILSLSYFVMGLNLTVFGPSLPSLAGNLNETIESLAPSLVVLRGAGYLVGSALFGLLEGKLAIQHLMLSSLVIISAGQAITPTFLNKISLFVFSTLSSIGLGGLETIGNVWCIQLWGVKVEPYIQLLQFSVCFGCAVLPFIASPFLNKNIIGSGPTENASLPTIGDSQVPYVSIIYFIIVTITMTVGLLFVVIHCLPESGKIVTKQRNTIRDEGKNYRNGMLLLIFIFFFFYAGLEQTFVSFLFTFFETDVIGMSYSKEGAANLYALFYISVTIGQFVAIFLSRKFSPAGIILTDLLVLLISTISMACLPLYASTMPKFFWIVLSLSGLSGASVYGSMFLWAERYVTVNGRAASIFIVGASFGEMVLPLPVGSLIESKPMSLLYFEVGYSATLLIVFLSMTKAAAFKGKRLKSVDASGKKAEEETTTSSGLL